MALCFLVSVVKHIASITGKTTASHRVIRITLVLGDVLRRRVEGGAGFGYGNEVQQIIIYIYYIDVK